MGRPLGESADPAKRLPASNRTCQWNKVEVPPAQFRGVCAEARC
ncbi:MAG: hypothetical protein Ct9H300mP1_30070 [Planctomycetaceae bacterium]|nr:MAG: hypothetical protein Ct9H300mP1_30070 [Planctomycetaceae bacterium]